MRAESSSMKEIKFSVLGCNDNNKELIYFKIFDIFLLTTLLNINDNKGFDVVFYLLTMF